MVASKAKIVTEQMFLSASQVLSQCVAEEELHQGLAFGGRCDYPGLLFPSISSIRDVSAKIGAAVANVFSWRRGF